MVSLPSTLMLWSLLAAEAVALLGHLLGVHVDFSEFAVTQGYYSSRSGISS